MDIVERLSFDAARCEAQFSKGVAGNIQEARAEIERLRADNERMRAALQKIIVRLDTGSGYRAGPDVHEIASRALEQKQRDSQEG